jgi:hypothetical protein
VQIVPLAAVESDCLLNGLDYEGMLAGRRRSLLDYKCQLLKIVAIVSKKGRAKNERKTDLSRYSGMV